jgi:tripartite motif-containing protein 71
MIVWFGAAIFTVAAAESIAALRYEYAYQWRSPNRPRGLAVSKSGFVFVTDTLYPPDYPDPYIRKYSLSGKPIIKWSSPYPRRYFTVNVETTGTHVYTTHYVNPGDELIVAKWTHNGALLGTFGARGKFPRAICWDNTSYLYVIYYGHEEAGVLKLTSDLKLVTTWGKYGTNPGELYDPWGITWKAPRFIYIADYWTNRIQKFTTNGTFVTEWFHHGPKKLAADDTGLLFVTDHQPFTVTVYRADASIVTSFGGRGSGPGQFNWPWDVDVDSRGFVYVCDSGNDRVQVFRPVHPNVAPASIGKIKALFR